VAARRDEAITALADCGCRFLVFGRTIDRDFRDLPAAEIPQSLRYMCDEVSESEFREDISSTELRNG
jgi:hypothetical protein